MMKKGTHGGLWTEPGKLDSLLRLLASSNCSASQIAEQLGTTRNAVIGKVLRLGLSLPNRQQTQSIYRSSLRQRTADRLGSGVSSRAAAQSINKTAPPPRPVLPPDCESVRFADIAGARGGCKYALGDIDEQTGPDMPCCGAPTMQPDAIGMQGSFCAHHYRVCVGEGTPSERAAERILEGV